MGMKVFGYVRVSTTAQAGEDRFGIPAQQSEIILWAERNKAEIVDWFIDKGVSGSSDNRPEFDRLIFGSATADAVVVAKSDRVARDIMLYYTYKLELLRKGMKLISVAEDFEAMGEYGEIFEALVTCIATQEKRNIMKRMESGRKLKAYQGGYAGGNIPLGYKVVDGVLKVDKNESVVVEMIFKQHERGLGIRRIANMLNESGISTRSGKPWSHNTVYSVLQNEDFYRGGYSYGTEVKSIKGMHEKLLY